MNVSMKGKIFTKTNLCTLLAGLIVALSALSFICADRLSIRSEQLPAMAPLPEITADTSYQQSFLCTEDGLTKIKVLTATFARSNTGTLTFILEDSSGMTVQTWEVNAVSVPDNSYMDLVLDEKLIGCKDSYYVLNIVSSSLAGSAPTIYTTNYGGSKGLSVNGENLDVSLCYTLEYELPGSSLANPGIILTALLLLILLPVTMRIAAIFFPVSKIWLLVFPELAAVIGCHRFLRHAPLGLFPPWFMAVFFGGFCLIWTLGSIFLYRWIFVKNIPVHKLALIVLSVFSVFMIGFLTPGTGNDEQFHYAFAYKYANIYSFKGLSDPVDADGDNLIYMRDEDAELLREMRDVPIWITEASYKKVIKDFRVFSSDNSLHLYKIHDVVDRTSFKNNNVPLGYILSGLAIAIARLLHLGALPTFYLGRIFNAAFFVFMVYKSIKIIPKGKETLFVFSLFPMVIQQAVTYSYDSFILGIVLLFTAMTVKVFVQEEKLSLKQFIILGVLAFAVAVSKYVYAPIIFILLALPAGKLLNVKNPVRLKRGILAGMGICGAAAFIILQNTRNILKFFIPSYAGQEKSVFIIIVKYWEMLQMTVVRISDFYVHSLVAYPGWYQIYVPVLIVAVYYLLLIFTLMRRKDETCNIGNGTRVLGVCLMILSCLLITLPMAARFTDPASETVDSIQGRYFLPLIPLLAMGLRTKHITSDDTLQKKVLFGAGYIGFLFFGFCCLKIFSAI